MTRKATTNGCSSSARTPRNSPTSSPPAKSAEQRSVLTVRLGGHPPEERTAAQSPSSRGLDQRDEADGQPPLPLHPFLSLAAEEKLLEIGSDRDDHPPPDRPLVLAGFGDPGRRRGDHDGIEGRRF